MTQGLKGERLLFIGTRHVCSFQSRHGVQSVNSWNCLSSDQQGGGDKA